MTRLALVLCVISGALLGLSGPAAAQQLFVGLENAALATRSSDLDGFPSVTWTNHFAFEVNGAAATPEGLLYLCKGPFTTQLYTSTLDGPPRYVTNISVDIHGMGYGGDKLYGFSNYASPMGIYGINPETGAATLLVSTASEGYRFFGLDFNAQDGLLYGYTEYGVSGLYSIDPVSGSMVRIVGVPPGVNGQGRALAVGENTVYLLATRGDEGEPCFAYDLDQGPFGLWQPFTNPYPTQHATGGAAWIPGTAGVGGHDDRGNALPGAAPRLWIAGPNPAIESTTLGFAVSAAGPLRVELFDAAGRWVRTLADGTAESGVHSIRWDGTDALGRRVDAGIYHARLSAAAGAKSARILWIR